MQVARRERPKVLAENGTATVLTNGVCLETDDRQCFTLAQCILKRVPVMTITLGVPV